MYSVSWILIRSDRHRFGGSGIRIGIQSVPIRNLYSFQPNVKKNFSLFQNNFNILFKILKNYHTYDTDDKDKTMQTCIAVNKSPTCSYTYNLRLDSVDPIPDLDRHQNGQSDPEKMSIHNTAYIHSCLVMFSQKCILYLKKLRLVLFRAIDT
jgi:hypothetical protein